MQTLYSKLKKLKKKDRFVCLQLLCDYAETLTDYILFTYYLRWIYNS